MIVRGLIVALLCASSAHAQDRVQLIGLNDFHGQLAAGKQIKGRAVGGASVLAAYVQREAAKQPAPGGRPRSS